MVATPDENGWYTLPDGKKTATVCPWCNQPYIPRIKTQKRCGSEACKVAALVADPERLERRRARFREGSRRYAERHREERKARRRKAKPPPTTQSEAPAPAPAVETAPATPDLWSVPGPDLGTHLPGAWRELVLDPPPAVPIPHTHATSIHGIVCRSIGLDHDRTRADFVLRQERVRSGWGVYFIDGAVARRLSCAPMPGLHLEGRPWGICYGPGVVVPRAPSGLPAGRYRVTLTTLSPVVIRRSADGKTLVRLTPTAASLRASLTGLEFFRRLGWTERKPPAWTRDVVLLLCGHDTRRDRVDSDGHWNAGDGQGHGFVTGWSGTVEIETIAPGLALLRRAEVVGLGGRVAVGFGQVRVTVDGPLDGRG